MQPEHRLFPCLDPIVREAGDRGRPSNYLYGAAKAAVSTYCEGLLDRLPETGSRTRRWLRHLLAVLVEARHCHRPGVLAQATVLGLLAWSAEAWAFHLVLERMGADTALVFAVFVYAISMLAGALSFMPGGLGSAEAVMVGLLVWQGVEPGDAVAATLVIRLATLWFAVGLGAGRLDRGSSLKVHFRAPRTDRKAVNLEAA